MPSGQLFGSDKRSYVVLGDSTFIWPHTKAISFDRKDTTMNVSQEQAIAILEAFGIHEFSATAAPGLAALLILNPDLTDAQLISEEDGSLKHLARKKIGWLVDVVWPAVSGYVDQVIAVAIPTARQLAGVAAA